MTSRHVTSLVSCDCLVIESCDFADVLMTLSLGSAELIMRFDWLHLFGICPGCFGVLDFSTSLFSVQ